MYLLRKTKFKNITVAILTLVMALSLVFCTACSCSDTTTTDDNDDTTTEEETITDYQVIKNGDFEFYTDEKTSYPYSSSIDWSRSTDSDKNSATSSSGASGIIDTNATYYDKLDNKNKPFDAQGNAINPGTPYSNNLITIGDSDKYDYEDEDLRVNPQLDGTKILMINNKTATNGLGTAQKFKSSATLSIPLDSYAILSIWVRTDNLKNKSVDTTAGAYILLTDKVGSSSYNNVEYRGIDTQGKWVEYKTVIKGSELGVTTYSITLGLGKGNGTFKKDYVEGFAYFDNITAKVYTKAEFKALNQTYTFEKSNRDDEVLVKPFVAPTTGNTITYAFDYKYDNSYGVTNLTPAGGNTAFNSNVVAPAYNYDLKTGNTITKTDLNTLNGATETDLNKDIKSAVSDIESLDITNPSLIYLNFTRPSSGYYITEPITISKKADDSFANYHYVTFFAKVSVKYEAAKMAKVEIVNETVVGETTTLPAYSYFTTETIENSAYGDWVQYKILVENPTDTDTKYQIKFTFGDDETAFIGTQYALQHGYAIFAGLNVETMSENYFNSVSTGDYAIKTTVYGKYANIDDDTENEVGDAYAISTDYYGKFEISTKPTSYIPNYTYVGESTAYKGVINSKYNDAYTFLTDNEKTVLSSLKQEINDYAQVVVLKNTTNNNSKLISPAQEIGKNTATIISLKIKTVGNTKATVSLVENEPNENGSFKPLELKIDDWSTVFTSTVESNSLTFDGWTEVRFYIYTGNQAINYRVVVSLNNDTPAESGAAFLRTVSYDSATIQTALDFDLEIEEYKKEFNILEKPLSVIKKHTRPSATVLFTNENGEDDEKIRTYSEEEVFITNGLFTFAKFSTVNADTTIDERVKDEDTSTEETEKEDKYEVNLDVGLQVSSIIIAVVIIIVLLAVLIRKFTKKYRNKKQVIESYYDRDTREKAMNKIAKKKASINVESDDNNEEYDYEAAEQVDETEEVPTEEATEETVEETTEEVIDYNEATSEENTTLENSEEQPTASEEIVEEVQDEQPSNE